MDDLDARQRLETDQLPALDRQIAACRVLGSPWTAAVLTVLRQDLADGGATRDALADYRIPAHPSALALRLAGALNFLASADDPDPRVASLAALHPSRRRDGHEAEDFADAVRHAMAARPDVLADFLERAVQTNEVQRSAVLAPGCLEIVARTGLPLDLVEIGSSGGLNLLWDGFRFDLGGSRFGPEREQDIVRIAPDWQGAPAPPAADAPIRSRRGVDITPLDLRDPVVVARGRAYVWPDQPRRLANFDAAVALLVESDVRVEQANASRWLPDVLAARAPGGCTVVMHSVMWQYMPPEDRQTAEAAIRAAGETATRERPLAWLRLEPRRDAVAMEVTLDLWPRAEDARRERLAWSHPHGAVVRWLEAGSPDRFAQTPPFEADFERR